VDGVAARPGAAARLDVPGRLQRLWPGQDVDVVVDYAHSPDALANTLEALRPVARLPAAARCGACLAAAETATPASGR
jgi:UDP-N-acetylmuramyl tripeptide synthase